MRILIIGKNSFIGKNYIKHSNYNEIIEISVRKLNLKEIDFSVYDIVIHLAAIVHKKKNIRYEEYLEVNSYLPVKVASLAKQAGVKQFVFMSTVSVYGKNNAQCGLINEFTQCKPITSYGRSKLKAEIELERLNDSNFTVSIIRPPLVYGENVKANMLSIIKLVDLIPILPFANIKNQRSMIAVENLVEYIDKIIENKTIGICLVCDPNPLSTSELVSLISKYLNKRPILFKIPKFAYMNGIKIMPNIFEKIYGSFIVKNESTLKKLDVRPKISTEEAIKKMIISYQFNKSKKS